MPIEPFQARVAQLALSAAAAHGFALAGGNALAAHGLLSRPTQDIDLFTATAGGTGQVVDAVQTALTADGYTVQLVVLPSTATSPNFTSAATARAPRSTWAATGAPTTPSASTSAPSCTSTTRWEPRPWRCSPGAAA